MDKVEELRRLVERLERKIDVLGYVVIFAAALGLSAPVGLTIQNWGNV